MVILIGGKESYLCWKDWSKILLRSNMCRIVRKRSKVTKIVNNAGVSGGKQSRGSKEEKEIESGN